MSLGLLGWGEKSVQVVVGRRKDGYLVKCQVVSCVAVTMTVVAAATVRCEM